MFRRNKTKVIANVRVGRPDVSPTAPSHVPGVFEGNRKHWFERPRGFHDEELRGTGSARRSTAIRPDAHDVIDPRMPKLSPS